MLSTGAQNYHLKYMYTHVVYRCSKLQYVYLYDISMYPTFLHSLLPSLIDPGYDRSFHGLLTQR